MEKIEINYIIKILKKKKGKKKDERKTAILSVELE